MKYKKRNEENGTAKGKDLGMMMQDTLPPEKHINKIMGDTQC